MNREELQEVYQSSTLLMQTIAKEHQEIVDFLTSMRFINTLVGTSEGKELVLKNIDRHRQSVLK